jgi:exopolysaccharide production protein ExoQ
MKILERITAVVIFLSAMHFFPSILYGKDLVENTLSGQNTGEFHVGIAIINVLLYVVAGVFMLRRYKQFFRSARIAWPMLALASLCVLSTMWSIEPQLTLRRSAYLAGATLFGVYLGGRYSIAELSKMLLTAFYLMCGFTLLYWIVAPIYVLDAGHENALRGLAGHKNGFGEIMSIFLLNALLYKPQKNRKLLRYASILIAGALLFASRSSTSILVCFGVACLVPFLSLFKLTPKQRWPAIFLALVILSATGYAALNSADSLLAAVGRDSTLTGRSVIWEMLLVSISRRPLLGYGFDAFWQGLKGESLNVIAGAGWLVPTAHNGYIEAMLSIGILGLLVFLACAFLMFKRSISYSRQVHGVQGQWPIAYLLFYLLHGISESTLLSRESLDYLLFVTLFTALALAKQEVLVGKTQKERLERLFMGAGEIRV